MAERIGDAFVRVHLHGEDLRDDIKEDLGELTDEFRAQGERDGKAHGEGLRRAIRKDAKQNSKTVGESVRLSSRDAILIGDESGKRYFQNLRKSLIANTKDSDVAEVMFKELQRKFIRSGGDYTVVEAIFGDKKENRAAFAQLFDFAEKEVGRSRLRMHDEALKMNREFDRIRKAHPFEEVKESIDDVNDRLGRSIFRLRGFRHGIDDAAEGIARGFGKGSRNDFLNFFGRLIGNLVRLTTLPLKVGEGFLKMGSNIARSFSQAEEGASFFSKLAEGFAGTGGAASKLLPLLGSVAAGLAAFLVIVPPIIAAFSLLAGIVTALAASISFALIGAVSSLAAILLPAGAAVAVLTAGILGMDDALKKSLKRSIQPFVTEFKGLAKVASEGLFSKITPTIDNLTKGFRGLRPLVKGVSVALADVGLGFSKAINSSGFRVFRDAFAEFLPNAIRTLGRITQQTLSGFGGIFRGMIPFMELTLRFLDRITASFAKWANSVEGQREIKFFFQDVAASVKSVGHFLGEVLGFISELFSAGRSTGDNIFDDMADAFERWTKNLKANPDILQDWFEDAKRFADVIGDLLVSVGKLLDTLDSPTARRQITDTFRAISTVVRGAAISFEFIDGIVGSFFNQLKGFAGFLRTFGDLFDDIFHFRIRAAVADIGALIYKALSEPFIAFLGIAQAGLKLLSHVPGFGWAKDAANKIGELRDELRETGDEIDRMGEKKPKINIDFTDVKDAKDRIEELYLSFGQEPPVPALKTIPKKFKAAFAEVLQAAQGAATIVKSILSGEEIKPKISVAEFSKLDKKAQESTNLLRTMIGLPPIVPKANPDNIKKVSSASKTATTDFGRLRNSVEKGAKTKVDKKAVDLANSATRSFIDYWRRVQALKNKTVKVTTEFYAYQHGTTKAATGGIFGPERYEAEARKMASGGFANFNQYVNIGESGREAVVPLDRPLSMVDPSVRALAAFAQGLTPDALPSVGVDASGWTIVSNADDAGAVAQEVINRLVAQGF